MLQYCGRRMTVQASAHKTCDTIGQNGLLRMENAVHLAGARCDGSGHDGCQAACLTFWKHAWLRKVEGGRADPVPSEPRGDAPGLLPLLTIASRRPAAEDGAPVYRCQATELHRFAPRPLPLKQVSQFTADVRTGNAGVGAVVRSVLVALYDRFQGLSKKLLPAKLWIKGGRQWGNIRGTAVKTPNPTSGLRPGDVVRIRSKDEVAATLNADGLNRGMGFDAEMGRFCGRTATVARRVDQIVDERNGRMIRMKSPCLVLENVVCEGAFNLNCPRAITPYWREAWLEKIGPATPADVPAAAVTEGVE
jgi:hypothetical protein